jgi:predicted transcriptional regulator
MAILGNKPKNGVIMKEMIDRETGEKFYIPIFTRSKHEGGFFMAIQEGFVHIAKLGLKGQELQILLFIMGKLDFENWIRVSQAEISKELNIARPHISSAIKKLVEFGILHKGPKVGTSYTYRLDPDFGYKGRASSKKKLKAEIAKKGLTVIEGQKS